MVQLPVVEGKLHEADKFPQTTVCTLSLSCVDIPYGSSLVSLWGLQLSPAHAGSQVAFLSAALFSFHSLSLTVLGTVLNHLEGRQVSLAYSFSDVSVI